VPKPRTGYVYKKKKTGKWIARVGVTDPNGRRRNLTRKCDNKPDAQKALKSLLSGLEESQREQNTFNDKTTFAQLADRYSPAKTGADTLYSGGVFLLGFANLNDIQ
jgi:hypothetical protein